MCRNETEEECRLLNDLPRKPSGMHGLAYEPPVPPREKLPKRGKTPVPFYRFSFCAAMNKPILLWGRRRIQTVHILGECMGTDWVHAREHAFEQLLNTYPAYWPAIHFQMSQDGQHV